MFDDKKQRLMPVWNFGLNMIGSGIGSSLPLASPITALSMPKLHPISPGSLETSTSSTESSLEQATSQLQSMMASFGFTGSPAQSRTSEVTIGPDSLARLSPFEVEDEIQATSQIQVIEWHMMDKWKFVPLSMASSFTIRSFLYPFTVIKTCIQVQHKNTVYTSMFDAFRKIKATEGFGGLYKGFWVSSFQIVSGVCYVSTYEGVRHLLYENKIHDSNLRALIAGGCASVVGQTFIVPFDVISQHLMVLGQASSQGPVRAVLNPLNVRYEGRTKFQITSDITREIYLRDGLKGYYRGYFASLGCYVPNSALWWGFYHLYQDEVSKLVPDTTSLLVVQCMSAILGGFTTTILTNPLDVCRARLQVQRLHSFPKTFSILCHEEGLRIFTKGLSARLTQSSVFSFSIILGYETIKRLSAKEKYRERVRW